MLGQPRSAGFLPYKPFSNRRLLAIGTSMTDAHTGTGSGTLLTTGPLNYANPKLGQRFDYIEKGASGFTLAQIYDRLLTDGLRYKPYAVWAEGGTNDIAGRSVAQIKADLNAIYSLIIASGAICIAVTITPRDASASWGATEFQKMHEVNNYILEYAAQNRNFYVVDFHKYIVDPDSVNGYAKSGALKDGTHFTPLGAYLASLAAEHVLAAIFPPYPAYLAQPLVADGTNSVNGIVSVNPMLQGADASTGTGASGTEPTAWRVFRNTGTAGTVASSVVTTPEPTSTREWTLAMTPGNVNESELFYASPDVTNTTVIAGAWYEAIAEVDISAYAGWRQCTLHAIDDPSGVNKGYYAFFNPFTSDNVYMPPYAMTGMVLKTIPFQATSNAVRLRMAIEIQGNVAGTPVVKIRKLVLRRIETTPNPSTVVFDD